MNDKPRILTEIEIFFNVKLTRVQYPTRSMLKIKKRSYSLNSNNEIVSLNLEGISVKEFPFSRDLQDITHLNLSNTELVDIDFLFFFQKLEYLDLSFNKIFNIDSVVPLKKIKFLNLANNKIDSIDVLQGLDEVEILRLNNNRIRDIEPLIHLLNLKSLDLSENSIEETNALNDLKNLEELKLSKNNLQNFPKLDNLNNLKLLNLSFNNLVDVSGIEKNLKLKVLNIRQNRVGNVKNLAHLLSLEHLLLEQNLIEDLSPLFGLSRLKNLRVSNNNVTYFRLESFKILTDLDLSHNPLDYFDVSFPNKLKELNLSHTEITNLDNFENLKNLTYLNLSNCRVSVITPLEELKKIVTLNLSNNNISNISPLARLSVSVLDISNNPVEDIHALFEIENNLQYLLINDTGFSKNNNLFLSHKENHLDIVKNRILILNSEGQTVKGNYPVKILFLGNHGGGKSQFLNFFLTGKLTKESESTDIIQIKSFKEKRESILPTAVFYDFGGQDFYHGLYRIFLSNQAIHCLFWHEGSNFNKSEHDVNKNPIQNFDVNYWIGQKKYNEHKEEFKDDLLLIETHSDCKESNKPTYYIFNEIEKNPRQQFYVSLKFDSDSGSTHDKFQLINLEHLKYTLQGLIQENQIPFEQKKWYLNFIRYITSVKRKEQATHIKDLLVLLKDLNTSRESKIQLLQTELDQLHRKGLVLYYRKEIPDYVWLNPLKIVNYVKEKVLIFEDIKKEKGILNTKYFEDKSIDPNILLLLQLQKVVFLHKYGVDAKNRNVEEFIVPNYLPLVSKDNDIDYDLFTFGIENQHIFTLKFNDFIPLGLINQLICFFGSLPDKKKFWRNQLIFTFDEKCKVLIYLDNENLEVKVYSHFLISDYYAKEQIVRYIYSCILSFYWDFKLVSFSEYKEYGEQIIFDEENEFSTDFIIANQDSRDFYEVIDCEVPSDLYISLNAKTFIKAQDLANLDESKETKINTYELYNKILQLENPKERPVYPFKIFTNKKLKKMKKIFVSYSHANIKEMEELTKYLVGFVRNKEIESWTDLKLQSGVKVKDEILKNLEDADIVILLISQDFIASDFIYDNELQMAMEKKLTGKGEIIPVVLSSSSIFDLKLNVTGDEGTMTEVKMGDYYFIPQGNDNNLLPIEKWQHKSEAWMKVYQDIKRKIGN